MPAVPSSLTSPAMRSDLLLWLLLAVLLLACDNNKTTKIVIVSDNPFLWYAAQCYNTSQTKFLLVVNYYENLTTWSADAADPPVQLFVTDKSPQYFAPLQPLSERWLKKITKLGNSAPYHFYHGIDIVAEGLATSTVPLALQPPFYLMKQRQKGFSERIIVPESLEPWLENFRNGAAPQLLTEATQLYDHPDYPASAEAISWPAAVEPAAIPWYLRLRNLSDEIPFAAVSVGDFWHFSRYYPERNDFKLVMLADVKGRWLPRKILRVMVAAAQSRQGKKSSLEVITWLMDPANHWLISSPESYNFGPDNQSKIGFLGGFSVYRRVNELSWSYLQPGFAGHVFDNGIYWPQN